jgi:hypothetical protein
MSQDRVGWGGAFVDVIGDAGGGVGGSADENSDRGRFVSSGSAGGGVVPSMDANIDSASSLIGVVVSANSPDVVVADANALATPG